MNAFFDFNFGRDYCFNFIMLFDILDKCKKYDVLIVEYNKLKNINCELRKKYETNLFELNKYKNDEQKHNKQLAESFLTDGVYHLKRIFELSKENKKLNEIIKKYEKINNELKYQVICKEVFEIKVTDKKILFAAEENYKDLIQEIIKSQYTKRTKPFFDNYNWVFELPKSEQIKFVTLNKKKIINDFAQYLIIKQYFNVNETDI